MQTHVRRGISADEPLFASAGFARAPDLVTRRFISAASRCGEICDSLFLVARLNSADKDSDFSSEGADAALLSA